MFEIKRILTKVEHYENAERLQDTETLQRLHVDILDDVFLLIEQGNDDALKRLLYETKGQQYDFLARCIFDVCQSRAFLNMKKLEAIDARFKGMDFEALDAHFRTTQVPDAALERITLFGIAVEIRDVEIGAESKEGNVSDIHKKTSCILSPVVDELSKSFQRISDAEECSVGLFPGLLPEKIFKKATPSQYYTWLTLLMENRSPEEFVAKNSEPLGPGVYIIPGIVLMNIDFFEKLVTLHEQVMNDKSASFVDKMFAPYVHERHYLPFAHKKSYQYFDEWATNFIKIVEPCIHANIKQVFRPDGLMDLCGEWADDIRDAKVQFSKANNLH